MDDSFPPLYSYPMTKEQYKLLLIELKIKYQETLGREYDKSDRPTEEEQQLIFILNDGTEVVLGYAYYFIEYIETIVLPAKDPSGINSEKGVNA